MRPKLTILTASFVAIAAGVISIKKCNSENRVLDSEAIDQRQQADAVSPAPKPQDQEMPSTYSSVNNAVHDAYSLEKTPPRREADAEVNVRYLGVFYNTLASPDTSKIKQTLGQRMEYIDSLQDSRNDEHVLFYDSKIEQWQVWTVQGNTIAKLEAQPPREVGSSHMYSWHWLDNDRLLGQCRNIFTPHIEGYEDEGWTESTRIYVFDLRTLTASPVAWPSPLTTPESQFQFDPLSDGNILTVPLKRYYSLHSISDQGKIHLVSFDTKAPEGTNERDEGWFILKQP